MRGGCLSHSSQRLKIQFSEGRLFVILYGETENQPTGGQKRVSVSGSEAPSTTVPLGMTDST